MMSRESLSSLPFDSYHPQQKAAIDIRDHDIRCRIRSSYDITAHHEGAPDEYTTDTFILISYNFSDRISDKVGLRRQS